MPPKKRAERRNIVPEALNLVVMAAKRDFDLAKDRYESTAVVLRSHTLWEREDGSECCDYDGLPWPCSTIIGIAFIYGVMLPEQWERASFGKGR